MDPLTVDQQMLKVIQELLCCIAGFLIALTALSGWNDPNK